jgi:hypothetical protein
MMRNVATMDELSPDLVAMVAARIDAAVVEAAGPYEVSVRLGLSEDEKRGPLGAVAMAFDYMLGSHGDEFGAIFERSDGHRYPPDLKDIPPETWNWWLALARQVSAPLARARLNDLCFTGGWGNRGQTARVAAESYLQAAVLTDGDGPAPDPGRNVDRTDHLQRALTLARKIRDKALADRVIADTVAAARESLHDGDARPGVILGLLRILAEDRTPPAELDQLLAEARDRYRDDAWHSASVIEFQMKRAGADSQVRVRLQHEAVQVWIAEAGRTAGLARMKNLETAIKLARDYGLPALADAATARLQALGSEDLGLKTHTARFTLPDQVAEAYFSAFTNAPSWEVSLGLLIAGDPPTGNVSVNREQAAQAATDAPLYAIISKTRLGGDHLPRFTASTDEQRSEWLLAECEIFRLNVQSRLIAEVLRRVWSKWGPIGQSELAAYLGQHTHVPEPLADLLARGFIRHFTGDFEAAAYTVTPKIEALARNIALACRLPLYRTQREKSPGQYPGLGALLPEMQKAGLNESWYRFLHTYLASVAGANFRNELLHGFVDEIAEPASALILTAALYLAIGIELSEPIERENQDAPDGGE